MRKSLLAALALACLSSAAMTTAAWAQSPRDATRAPSPLTQAPDTYRYDDAAAPGADDRTPSELTPSERAAADRAARDARAEQRADEASAWARRDLFCRRDAAGRTGYTSPREAARDEQARGTIGGTLGGAALGAIIGGAAGDAGAGAAIGAGAGLLAGSAVGADNARRAAADAEAEYGDAYHACMDTARDDDGRAFDGRDRDRYAADTPPPVYYRPYPYPYYYPSPRFYGPSFGFSFGIGPSYRGYYGPRRGYGRPYRGYGRH